ncbi:MAG: hypothetical protein M1305_07400 [Candidatus Marsarchaeota archaeon]|nr:hypothetical protein [Candidatus Marsarchaeota archaeon]
MRTEGYTAEDFDYFLQVLIDRWEEVDELKADWPSFDGEQKAVIISDWQANNAIQSRLEQYVDTREPTADQRTHYSRLKDVIAANIGALEAMDFSVRPLRESKKRAVA